MSIGVVAERTGLSTHALRFYEREGLLLSRQIARTSGGRRRFTREDVDWLGVCTKLRATGMPLTQIRRYAELVRHGPGNEPERLELLRDHEKRVTAQMAALKDCLELINWKVGIYQEHLAEGSGDPWTGTASEDDRPGR